MIESTLRQPLMSETQYLVGNCVDTFFASVIHTEPTPPAMNCRLGHTYLIAHLMYLPKRVVTSLVLLAEYNLECASGYRYAESAGAITLSQPLHSLICQPCARHRIFSHILSIRANPAIMSMPPERII